MDPRHPTTTRIIHESFDCEALERSKWAADRPFPFTPWESGVIVSVCLIALGAALYAANAAAGIPV